MADKLKWEKTDEGYRCGSAEADLMTLTPLSEDEDHDRRVFVILTFGEGATADTAYACIAAAMPFGLIAIRGTEENRVLARELHHQGRVRFAPFVGLPFEAFGVAAVKPA